MSDDAALPKVLQDQEDFVDQLIREMERAGIGKIGTTMVDKALRPILQGIVVAYVNGVAVDEVSHAIVNISAIGYANYLTRRCKTRDQAIDAAQEFVNLLSEELGENINLQFPAKVDLLKGRKMN